LQRNNDDVSDLLESRSLSWIDEEHELHEHSAKKTSGTLMEATIMSLYKGTIQFEQKISDTTYSEIIDNTDQLEGETGSSPVLVQWSAYSSWTNDMLNNVDTLLNTSFVYSHNTDLAAFHESVSMMGNQ
jgi:hypothetical protein